MSQPNQRLAEMVMTGRQSGWGGFYWNDAALAGSISPKEGRILYEAVKQFKPKTILEIGTGEGFSTLYLAQACKDVEVGHVYTVEIGTVQYQTARLNIEAAGLSAYVTQSEGIPYIGPGLAFIDAGHTAEAVFEYLKFVEGCPMVFVHDAAHNDHVREACAGTAWQVELMDTDTVGKMARLIGKGAEVIA